MRSAALLDGVATNRLSSTRGNMPTQRQMEDDTCHGLRPTSVPLLYFVLFFRCIKLLMTDETHDIRVTICIFS